MTTTDTPRTDAVMHDKMRDGNDLPALSRQLERELNASRAEVERLRNALQSCYWATNTYDGNYTRACDNVATIAINALKTQDK